MADLPIGKIILGVCGSTAATKSQSLALALQRAGFQVRVAMTSSAQRFISPLAISSVIHEPLYIDMWSVNQAGEVHIEWAAWADAMIVAPATASFISDISKGVFNNCVSLVAGNLRQDQIFLAPAMSQEMWEHPAVKNNVRELISWGVRLIGPVPGIVASGNQGMRLAEPSDIAKHLKETLVNS